MRCGGRDGKYEIISIGNHLAQGERNGRDGTATYKDGKKPLPRTARNGSVTMIIEIA